jgi:hypothetical protein
LVCPVGTTARVFLHKSKRNTNGSFSIGKTWDIIDLRTVELLDVSLAVVPISPRPLLFLSNGELMNVSLIMQESAFRLIIGQRSYTWLAENGNERKKFVDVLIRSFRQYSQGELPQLIGLPNSDYC